MMRTPSLRRRVLVTGGTVVATVIVGFGIFVYLVVRAQLYGALAQLLAERATLAHKLAAGTGPTRLASRLRGHGVRATLLSGPHPRGGGSSASPGHRAGTLGGAQLVRDVRLPHGFTLRLAVSTAGASRTLDHLVLLELLGALVGLAVAWLALRRASSLALAPLDQVVTTARAIASGNESERLRPDSTDTELGRMAAAFDDMLDALALALEQARVAEQRSRVFLADAAHQLRTPVAGIQASAEALLSVRAADDELLANIARETSRAGRLLRALLRLARMDAGAAPQRQPCDLVALVGQEVERQAALAPGLAVSFRVHGASMVEEDSPVVVGDAPVVVEIDALAVGEALAAVLDNSRRHARSRIEVVLIREAGSATIRVVDDGPGLPAGSEQQAFERFVTLDGAGGSGLGLSLAREVARAHGGELSYAEGAFLLGLPLPGK